MHQSGFHCGGRHIERASNLGEAHLFKMVERNGGAWSLIDMALLSVIRRWHFREGVPIREIERRTGLSRNTIRKYLRSGAVEPRFKVPERPSKLDPFADKLSVWLQMEAGKSRKQRRTAKQMHADLVALGFEGGYGRVAAFGCRAFSDASEWP